MRTGDPIEPTPEDWLADSDEEFVVDELISHPDAEFPGLRDKASGRLRIEHEVVAGFHPRPSDGGDVSLR